MKKLIKKNILITGGAGFIGSIVTLILKKIYNVYVIDDLSLGLKKQVRVDNFYKLSLNNKKKLNFFFKKNKIYFVIHLAAYSNLRNSEKNSVMFYKNNYQATKNLIDCCIKYKIKKFIFSSTASVYGSPKKLPITEKTKTRPISVYGKTKLKAENYIISNSKKNYNYIIFRFFNVAGGINKYELGETKNPPEHFIPIAIQRILNGKKVNIFNGFNTKDGSGVRDYIHVKDVAEAIKKALLFLEKTQRSLILNLGSKKSISTIEILSLLKKILKRKIYVKYLPKNNSEPDILLSTYKRAENILKWKPKKNILNILRDALDWEIFLKKRLFK